MIPLGFAEPVTVPVVTVCELDRQLSPLYKVAALSDAEQGKFPQVAGRRSLAQRGGSYGGEWRKNHAKVSQKESSLEMG